jgi:hypothetical protein
MLFQTIKAYLESAHAPDQRAHLRGLWGPWMETQINTTATYTDQKTGEVKKWNPRIPKGSSTDSPTYEDTTNFPDPKTWIGVGVSGWDWADQRSRFLTFDVDAGDHAAGHDDEIIADIIRALTPIAEVQLLYSKGGRGVHIRVYFDEDDTPRTTNHNEHGALARPIARWLSERSGIDLERFKDCAGFIAWIAHTEAQPGGFQLIKKSTAALPREAWDQPADQPTNEPAAKTPLLEMSDVVLSSDQQKLVKLLKRKRAGEFKDGRLQTHTASLLKAHKALKLPGDFDTVATGKDGPGDRNCFLHPQADGSWRVIRHGKGVKEARGWFISRGGWTTCIIGRKLRKTDAPMEIVELAKAGELFHDEARNTFATIEHRGQQETVAIGDDLHRSYLRLLYTDATGQIASREAISTAIDQLKAVAKSRNEYKVAIRVADHDGNLYIDLANVAREVVKVTPNGYSVITSGCPVRFRRVAGMLPLPTPIPGGNVHDLFAYLNVDEEDRPLMLGFIVGAFHPDGPYPLLQLVGEQGSAKSSTARLLHDFIDPNVAVCGNLPKDSRNLLVAAEQTWLLSFDNLDGLTKEQSALLCKLATGQSEKNRTLFSDKDQTILKAKRPVILTGIRENVTKSDLLDRTLTIRLPVIEPGKRKSEHAIDAELRKDGVRGRIFGAILDGVVSALAGHASVTLKEAPRMLDFFTWATAAEKGLRLPDHSIVNAYRVQAAAQADGQVDESVFAEKVKQLCEGKGGWKGNAKELAGAIAYGYSARDAAGELREIAPNLRRLGYAVKETTAKGRTHFHLGVLESVSIV